MHTRAEVINLLEAPSDGVAWGKPKFVVFLWAIVEILFVTNHWQVSSRIRVFVLRLFGAQIGKNVVFRPRTRVKFPWKLNIGDRCWIGEGVWFHNQDHIYLGTDVVVSQETMLTTGSHAYRTDMALIAKPIQIESGVWITSRCLVLGGSTLAQSSMVQPSSVIRGYVPAGEVWCGNPATFVKKRFSE
jgi:putative colanic acid biosynthesis acetyltransferase WcaF